MDSPANICTALHYSPDVVCTRANGHDGDHGGRDETTSSAYTWAADYERCTATYRSGTLEVGPCEREAGHPDLHNVGRIRWSDPVSIDGPNYSPAHSMMLLARVSRALKHSAFVSLSIHQVQNGTDVYASIRDSQDIEIYCSAAMAPEALPYSLAEDAASADRMNATDAADDAAAAGEEVVGDAE